MTLDIAAVKRRRTIMLVINGLAVLGALAGAVAYFRYAQGWALLVFVAAMLAGFGAQIWFIAGLRGRTNSDISSERDVRASRRT